MEYPVKKSFSFSRDGNQYHPGETISLSDNDKARDMIRAGLIGMPKNEIETKVQKEQEYEYRYDYRAAQRKVKHMGLDISANSSHDDLIEAIDANK